MKISDNSIYKEILIFIFLVISIPFVTGGIASFNAATEEEEVVIISSEKERSMGRKIDKKVKKYFDLPADPLVQQRIRNIGKKLAENTDRKDVVYRFMVLTDEKNDNYNAFAVPGGYIYIFDDLVEVLETDDNIAAVLAHEMGHIEAKHSVKRMQGSLWLTALMLLGSQMKTGGGDKNRETMPKRIKHWDILWRTIHVMMNARRINYQLSIPN